MALAGPVHRPCLCSGRVLASACRVFLVAPLPAARGGCVRACVHVLHARMCMRLSLPGVQESRKLHVFVFVCQRACLDMCPCMCTHALMGTSAQRLPFGMSWGCSHSPRACVFQVSCFQAQGSPCHLPGQAAALVNADFC